MSEPKLSRIGCRVWPVVTPVLTAFLLCGCTDAGQFQAPIATFATAANSAAASFATLDAASAANLSALRQAEAIQGKRIGWAPTDCSLTSKGCSLYFMRSGEPDQKPVYVVSLIPKSVAFVDGIKDYANALNQLEKADASADVQAAFSSAMGTISVVAGTLNLPAGAASAALAKPLSAVVGWTFGQYQNGLKNDALKTATSAADSVIQKAMPILDAELKFAQQAQLAELEQDFHDKDDAFSRQATETNLKAEIQAANALNTALSAQPSKLFDSLATAHTKLTAAIQNPKGDPSDTIAAIAAFMQQAQNVQQVVEILSQPAKN